MITRITALGLMGFLQLLRSRIYLNLLVAGVGLVLSAFLLNELAGGDGPRVLIDLGLAFIALLTSALAGIVAIVTMTREIETKQVHHILARPVHRAEVVLGRFLTAALLILASTVTLGLILGATAEASLAGSGGPVVAAAVFSSFEALIVAAAALVFGVGSSSTMSAVFTTTVFLLGRLTLALRELLDAGKLDAAKPVLEAAYAALPHFFSFDLSAWARGSAPFDGTEVAQAAAYGVCYAAALLAFACFRLQRRDLV